MKVAVIQDSNSGIDMKVSPNIKTGYRLDHLIAFKKGISKDINDKVDIVNSRFANRYDCAVIYGSYKPMRGRPAHREKGTIIESGMPYAQLETQLIGRPITTAVHNEYRVGVNGFLWDDAEWGFDFINQSRYVLGGDQKNTNKVANLFKDRFGKTISLIESGAICLAQVSAQKNKTARKSSRCTKKSTESVVQTF